MSNLTIQESIPTEFITRSKQCLDLAMLCEVKDAESLREAEQGKALCDDLDQQIAKELEPTKKSLASAHKNFVAFEKRQREDAQKASSLYGEKILTYRREEKVRLDKAEAERQQELRRQEEERRLAQAATLEKQGKKQEAERALTKPIIIPAAKVEPPKPEGHVVVKTIQCTIDDKAAAVKFFAEHMEYEKCVELVESQLKVLGRAGVKIPGVTFYYEEGLSRRRS